MEKIAETTGSRINELIKEKGLQKKAFAVDMQVTPQTVTGWLKGTIPHKHHLDKIANYFGVDVRYLMCKTNFRNIEDRVRNGYNIKDVNEIKSEKRENTIKELLALYGYEFELSHYSYEKTIRHYKNEILFDEFELTDGDHFPYYRIVTPEKETKYLSVVDAIKLRNIMFDLLERFSIPDYDIETE